MYDKNYFKTKIKSYGNKVTDFYDKKIRKLHSNYNCLAVITLDSALKKDDSYYLKCLLRGCIYIEKKVVRDINENLMIFLILLMSLR